LKSYSIKIVHTRLYIFLSSNNILYEYQFGFRKFHSTGLALIDVVDNIFEHLDNCDSGVGICIDLQKAFDTVKSRIFLKKLDRCGIRGIMFDWIQDYLSNSLPPAVRDAPSLLSLRSRLKTWLLELTMA